MFRVQYPPTLLVQEPPAEEFTLEDLFAFQALVPQLVATSASLPNSWDRSSATSEYSIISFKNFLAFFRDYLDKVKDIYNVLWNKWNPFPMLGYLCCHSEARTSIKSGSALQLAYIEKVMWHSAGQSGSLRRSLIWRSIIGYCIKLTSNASDHL